MHLFCPDAPISASNRTPIAIAAQRRESSVPPAPCQTFCIQKEALHEVISFAQRPFRCSDPYYSAGRMNESELNTFFVTIGSSVGKPTSTPMTFSPLFATRTEI